MRILRLILKSIALIIAIAVLAIFSPVIPNRPIEPADPLDVSDSRVGREISQEDLTQLLSMVRRGSYTSVYEMFRFGTRQPLIGIGLASSTLSYSVDEDEYVEVPPKGDIVAVVGFECGEPCGSGTNLYFVHTDGGWELVHSHNWIA